MAAGLLIVLRVFFRSTPAILHIMLIYLGVPLIADQFSRAFHLGWSANQIPVAVFVIMALSLTAGAYMTEILRSGIMAVDTGQAEAAYSIGLTRGQMIRRVVLPQAFMISLPNFTNIGIGFCIPLPSRQLLQCLKLQERRRLRHPITMRFWKHLSGRP